MVLTACEFSRDITNNASWVSIMARSLTHTAVTQRESEHINERWTSSTNTSHNNTLPLASLSLCWYTDCQLPISLQSPLSGITAPCRVCLIMPDPHDTVLAA